MHKVLLWWNKAAENKILNFETLKLCTTASKRIISEKWKYTMVVIEWGKCLSIEAPVLYGKSGQGNRKYNCEKIRGCWNP